MQPDYMLEYPKSPIHHSVTREGERDGLKSMGIDLKNQMGNQQERLMMYPTRTNLKNKKSLFGASPVSSQAIRQAPEFQRDEDMVGSHVKAWEKGGTETTFPPDFDQKSGSNKLRSDRICSRCRRTREKFEALTMVPVV